MKTRKNVFLMLLFILSTTLHAQSFSPISKGTYTVGGNIGFSSMSQTDDEDNVVYFSFTPDIGYFFIDNFYTSLELVYRYIGHGDYSANSYGIGPAFRYYINFNNLKPFLGVRYSYGIKKERGSSHDDFSSNEFGMSMGADYFITNYFALEGKIDYTLTKAKYTYSNSNDTREYDYTNLYIGFGAKYFIH